MSYAERPTEVAGVVVWHSRIGRDDEPRRILPDGCMDIVWDGRRLVVAGPDTVARWHPSPPDTTFAGLRFTDGLGPAFLGVPAHELRDTMPDLDAVLPAASVRQLTDEVAADAVAGLEAWLTRRSGDVEPDPLGAAVFALAGAGATPAEIGDRVGLGVRHLHRRSESLFGYGPQHLRRVLRLQRAIARAGSWGSLAAVAANVGYADQAHLSRDVRSLTGSTPRRLLREQVVPPVERAQLGR